jgi:hypothetical protein
MEQLLARIITPCSYLQLANPRMPVFWREDSLVTDAFYTGEDSPTPSSVPCMDLQPLNDNDSSIANEEEEAVVEQEQEEQGILYGARVGQCPLGDG